MLRRPITSGSRQAPDPYDQFLESRCLYRKHTARDASCLFRVIAEQMYDTQMLHYEIRLECVRFMTRKRRIFEQHIRGDFDSYMMDMSKPKTYGTMLELRALCCMYRRNVILFEPYNLGTSVTYNVQYKENFRVFYTNEYHFDSVYKLEYIEMAAICQSICFKLLYKMLFKLPDVSYAVETMLHPQTFEWGNYDVEFDDRGYIRRIVCDDGRTFALDMPEYTKCILENYKLCHFHSYSKQQQRGGMLPIKGSTSTPGSVVRRDLKFALDLPDQPSNSMISSDSDSETLLMCPNRLNSCVRQLLDDGITPFPYKVAKSLDPFMYRNIEFDSWNDMRKEAKRYNVYANDYNFKVGAKCRVEMSADNDRQLYTCYIQKIAGDKSYCVVFIEQFGKKYLVPYDALHPVPPDEFRPWAVPFRFQRQMQRLQLTKFINKPKVPKWKKAKVFDMGNFFEPSKCEVLQYMQLDNAYGFPPIQNEHGEPHQQGELHEPSEAAKQRQHRDQRFQPRGKQSHQDAPPTAALGASPSSAPMGQFVNYMPMSGRPGPGPALGPNHIPPQWPGSPLSMTEEFQASSFPAPPVPLVMHFGGYAQPPPAPQHPTSPYAPSPYMFAPQPPMPRSVMPPLTGAHSNCSSSNNSCNANTVPRGSDDQSEPRRSLQADDLPVDLGTLRYFYNIGVETHNRLINNNNSNNTDQQQQKQRNDEAVALVNNTTPPPSPEVITPIVGASPCTSSIEPTSEKARAHSKRGAINKMRSKRPEQLQDLSKDTNLSHVAMLPTPTPSPNTNGNHFNFYPTQPQGPALPANQPLPLQPPIFYPHQKGGQSPYGWGIAPPPGAVGMPYEMHNNHTMDNNATVKGQSGQPPAGFIPPHH